MPNYVAIGNIEIDDELVNQVAASQIRLEKEKSGIDMAPGEPTVDKITEQDREKARKFIESHFLSDDESA
jgi:hypothetical protein